MTKKMAKETARQYLNRMLRNGYKLEDAIEDLDMRLERCDAKYAIPGHPKKCVMARNGKRCYNIKEVLVFDNYVYALIDHTYWRYWASARTRAAIREFDKTGIWPILGDGVYVVLYAPKGVRTLKYRRSQQFKEQRQRSYHKRKGKGKRPHRTGNGFTLEEHRASFLL